MRAGSRSMSNRCFVAHVLEELASAGIRLAADPAARLRATDGYAWWVHAATALHVPPPDTDAWLLVRVFSVTSDGISVVCRKPNGPLSILRLFTGRPVAPPDNCAPCPHVVGLSPVPGHDRLYLRDFLRMPSVSEVVPPGASPPGHVLAYARRLVDAARGLSGEFCISPHNVFVDRFNRIVFTDVGIWPLSELPGAYRRGLRGPSYFDWVAPEILFRETADGSAAFGYSVGAFVWHSLFGEPPPKQPADDPEALQWQLSRELARYSGLPADLREFLLRNCGGNPRSRLTECEELADELAALMRTRIRLRGTLVASRREGLPWLREKRPRVRPALTPLAKAAVWLATCGGMATAAAVAVPPELAARAAHRLGLPSTLPAASLAPTKAHTSFETAGRHMVRSQEELFEALDRARAGDTIVLAAPGPYRLSETTVHTNVRIEGADGILPLCVVVGGPGLRATCERLELRNLHFVILSDHAPADGPAALVFTGQTLLIADCSFQTWEQGASVRQPTAVQVISRRDSAQVRIDNSYVRGFARGITVAGKGDLSLEVTNTTFAGCQNAIELQPTLVTGKSNSISVRRCTVVGGTLADISYAPGFEKGAVVDLRVEEILALPYDRSTPVLAVSYPAPFGQLLSHFGWEGRRVVVPTGARMLVIRYVRSRAAFVINGVAQWDRFWGDVDTGVVGLDLPFANALPPGSALRSTLGESWGAAGADASRHLLPDVTSTARAVARLRTNTGRDPR